ncbi:MAG: hypothetical protein EOP11_00395 [Proteobacteria bacterium]|nr:MAG: hypothetical protein EOP11_00395 [Pseudomonadota bacterium]
MIIAVCTVPFLVQGMLMVVDEFYFHRERGLSQWEVLGHPLDTITVACALCFLLVAKPSVVNLFIFGALSTFSCLFVTKDEFVHQEACKPLEHWLHAVLFLLHPVVFFAAGVLWWQGEGLYPLRVQTGVVALFGLYQLLYWRKRAA